MSELLVQCLQRVAVATGDGVDGTAGHRGDFVEGEIPPELEGDDFALILRQGLQRLLNDGGGLFLFGQGVKSGRVFTGHHDFRLRLTVHPAVVGAALIEGNGANSGVEQGDVVGVPLREAPPPADEGLLDHVFGIRLGVHQLTRVQHQLRS